MSNNKQTAVEWLQVQLNKNGKLSVIDFYQAKRMEREQREKDFVDGYKNKAEMSNSTFDEISEYVAKELFNKTFKTKNHVSSSLSMREIAEQLWSLLDNIDTLSDICKPTVNDPKAAMAFYNNAMKYAAKRKMLFLINLNPNQNDLQKLH